MIEVERGVQTVKAAVTKSQNNRMLDFFNCGKTHYLFQENLHQK